MHVKQYAALSMLLVALQLMACNATDSVTAQHELSATTGHVGLGEKSLNLSERERESVLMRLGTSRPERIFTIVVSNNWRRCYVIDRWIEDNTLVGFLAKITTEEGAVDQASQMYLSSDANDLATHRQFLRLVRQFSSRPSGKSDLAKDPGALIFVHCVFEPDAAIVVADPFTVLPEVGSVLRHGQNPMLVIDAEDQAEIDREAYKLNYSVWHNDYSAEAFLHSAITAADVIRMRSFRFRQRLLAEP